MDWISISVELPKPNQNIIIYFKNTAGWHVWIAWFDGFNFIDNVDEIKSIYDYLTPVTHWMPLPLFPIIQ